MVNRMSRYINTDALEAVGFTDQERKWDKRLKLNPEDIDVKDIDVFALIKDLVKRSMANERKE